MIPYQHWRRLTTLTTTLTPSHNTDYNTDAVSQHWLQHWRRLTTLTTTLASSHKTDYNAKVVSQHWRTTPNAKRDPCTDSGNRDQCRMSTITWFNANIHCNANIISQRLWWTMPSIAFIFSSTSTSELVFIRVTRLLLVIKQFSQFICFVGFFLQIFV